MKIKFRLSKPTSGIRVTASVEDAKALCDFLKIPETRLDLGFISHTKQDGNDVVKFRFRDHHSKTGHAPQFRSAFREYVSRGSCYYRAQYRIRDGIAPAPNLPEFGTIAMTVEVSSNGDLVFVLPPEEQRPNPVTNKRLRYGETETAPAPSTSGTDGAALVLMSFAGKEMTFTLPLGEAFEMAVNLTAKGYGK